MGETRQINTKGQKVYTLWDIYPHADLVTYPSIYEGFGNALLEAIYFRLPIVVNRYEIYARDIEPKGFRIPTLDNVVTKKTVDEVRRLIDDPNHRKHVVEHNHNIASRFFSYGVVRRKLRALIANVMGE